MRPHGWAAPLFEGGAPRFSELEERAGMAHMLPCYKYTSHRVHAGSTGTAAQVLERGPDRYLLVGATNADLADSTVHLSRWRSLLAVFFS